MLLVEAVHDVPGASAGEIARARWQTIRREDARLRAGTRVLWDVLLDAEGSIEKVTGEGGTGRRVGAVRRQRRRCQIDVVLQQTVVRRACLPNLRGVPRVGAGPAVDRFPTAVQIVEAVVLLVDHHDVIDAPKRIGRT